jgi:hypothetical protein
VEELTGAVLSHSQFLFLQYYLKEIALFFGIEVKLVFLIQRVYPHPHFPSQS